jgi:hypothetical protein
MFFAAEGDTPEDHDELLARPFHPLHPVVQLPDFSDRQFDIVSRLPSAWHRHQRL